MERAAARDIEQFISKQAEVEATEGFASTAEAAGAAEAAAAVEGPSALALFGGLAVAGGAVGLVGTAWALHGGMVAEHLWGGAAVAAPTRTLPRPSSAPDIQTLNTASWSRGPAAPPSAGSSREAHAFPHGLEPRSLGGESSRRFAARASRRPHESFENSMEQVTAAVNDKLVHKPRLQASVEQRQLRAESNGHTAARLAGPQLPHRPDQGLLWGDLHRGHQPLQPLLAS